MGLAALLGAVVTWTTIVVCGSVSLAVLFRLIRRAPAGFRAIAAAVLVIGATVALTTAAVVSLDRVVPPRPLDVALAQALQAAACMALAVAVLLVTLDRLAVRRNLAEVARLLGAQNDPLTVEAILSRTVGDPGLRVGYWTDEIGYVGADGLPLGETDTARDASERS